VKVFLDTNVLVSAFASRGLCADLFELVILDHDLIVGRNVLRELEKALRGKIGLSLARSNEIVAFVAAEASVLVDAAEPMDAGVEADDALVLGEARDGQAQMFVTGDAALLRLGKADGFEIVSPRLFWEALHAGQR
jgi:putative PIN family toxin of toxin-antitoxin system